MSESYEPANNEVPAWTMPGSTPEVPPPPPGFDAAAAPVVTGATSAAAAPAPGASSWKPGILPLRPLRAAEILDAGIKAIRHNPRVMIGQTALVYSIFTVLSLALVYLSLDSYAWLADYDFADPNAASTVPSDGTGVAGIAGNLLSLVQLFVLVPFTAVLIYSTSRSIIGQRATAGEAWGRAKARVGALMGYTGMLIPIGIGVFIGLIPVILVLAFVSLIPVLGSIIMVAGLVGYFALWTTYFGLALPIISLENAGTFAAIGRNFALVKGNFGRTWFALFLTYVVAAVVGLIVVGGVLVSYVAIAGGDLEVIFDPTSATFAWMLVVTSIVGFLVQIVGTPFSAGVLTALYTDLRIRREGFDLQLAQASQAA